MRSKTPASLVAQTGSTVTIKGKGYTLPRAEEEWLVSMGAKRIAVGDDGAEFGFDTAAQAREVWGWLFGNGRANVDALPAPVHFVGEPMTEMAVEVAEEAALAGRGKRKGKGKR